MRLQLDGRAIVPSLVLGLIIASSALADDATSVDMVGPPMHDPTEKGPVFLEEDLSVPYDRRHDTAIEPHGDDGDEDPTTTTYSKEDLKFEKPENPVMSFSQVLHKQVSSFAAGITRRQRGKNRRLRDIVKPDDLPSASERRANFALVRDPREDPTVDFNDISSHLGKDAQHEAADRFTNQIEFWQKLKGGFSFDLDLKEVFEKPAPEPQVAARPEVRYGLILEKATLSPDLRSHAAVGNLEEEIRYAKKAELKYTIGPIEDPADPTPDIPLTTDATVSSAPVSASQIESFYVPPPEEERRWFPVKSSRVSGNIKLSDMPDLVDAESNASNIPGFTLSAGQQEGIYRIEYLTDHNLTKIGQKHIFDIPVYRTLKVGRKYDDKWVMNQTTLRGMLLDPRAPSLGIDYDHQKDFYKAVLTYGWDPNYQKVQLSAETPHGWESQQGIWMNSGVEYEIEYSTKF